MNIDDMKKLIKNVVVEYPIKKVTLFGSRANNTNRSDSDVDLIIEFYEPVSLLTLSRLRLRLEELLGLDVDLVHGPLQKDDLVEVNNEVELYVA